MLASITPLGERARGSVWWRTATAYVVASTAGGAAFGAALGAVGGGVVRAAALSAVPARLLLVAGLVALLATAADVGGRLPTIRRQVDERWLVTYRDWVYGAGFGAQLGLGAVTIVTSASVYLTWALELLAASPARGALVGAVFGLARALPLFAFAGVTDAERLRAGHRRLASWLPPVARLTVAGQAVAALALIGLGLGGLA